MKTGLTGQAGKGNPIKSGNKETAMPAFFRQLSVCFTAGLIGGLTNAIFVWGTGAFGLSAMMGVAIAPAWTPPWLYQRLVWGGIWGLAFVLPILSGSILARGFVFGLGPTAVQLLVVFPKMLGKGMYGLELGHLTPVYVVLANTVWGVAAAWWMSISEDSGSRRSRL